MAVSIADTDPDDDDDFAEAHEINVTPFIDVILVLLIIFMSPRRCRPSICRWICRPRPRLREEAGQADLCQHQAGPWPGDR